MSTRLSKALVTTCTMLLLMFAAAPAAYAQTRAAPKGDMFDNPILIPLNSTKTVKKIELATEEGAADDLPSCDADDSAAYSVWFRFDMPSNGQIDIFSDGTLLVQAAYTQTIPMIALFSYDSLLGLDEEVCSMLNPSLHSIVLPKGEYRVRLASDVPIIQGSRYRLTVRARALYTLLENPAFADPTEGNWKIKNAGNPPQVYRECPSDECRIRFNGAAGGKISQSFSVDPSQLKIVPGDMAILSIGVNSTPVTGSDVKYTLQVVYSDGTPTVKLSRKPHVTFTTMFGSYLFPNQIIYDIESKAVKSMKVTISSPTETDTFSILAGSLGIYAGANRDTPAALPLPPSP